MPDGVIACIFQPEIGCHNALVKACNSLVMPHYERDRAVLASRLKLGAAKVYTNSR